MDLRLKLTAVFEPDPEGGFLAYIEEIPGVNSQGETVEEAKTNLLEALELAMAYNREEAEADLKERGSSHVHREEFEFVNA